MSTGRVCFIVPALIRNDEAEALLDRTLGRIPGSIQTTVALVTQGRQPTLGARPGLQILSRHYAAPLGKWGAIAQATELLPDIEAPVILLDADDPTDCASIEQAVERCMSRPDALWIGRRDRIALRADDEISADSRLFWEAFSNALLLGLFPEPPVDLADAPDLQSGFMAVPLAALRAAPLRLAPNYGGELVLCRHLWSNGLATCEIDYRTHARTESTYRLKQITIDTMNLPFFRDLPLQQIGEAMRRGPRLYRRYFTDAQLKSYDGEIRAMVQLAGGAHTADVQ